ncbi:MAG: hypothetical protein N2C14_27970, partial [Planctomycetales bacterium]
MTRITYIAGGALLLGLCAFVTLQAQDRDDEARSSLGHRLQMLRNSILGGRTETEGPSDGSADSRPFSDEEAAEDEPRRNYHPSDVSSPSGETVRVHPAPSRNAATASASDSALVPNGPVRAASPSGFGSRSSSQPKSSSQPRQSGSSTGSSSRRVRTAREQFEAAGQQKNEPVTVSQRPSDYPSSRRFPSRTSETARAPQAKSQSQTFNRPSSSASASVPKSESASPKRTPPTGGSNQFLKQKSVLLRAQSPILALETIGPRRVVIDKEAVYTVTIRNDSGVAAQDVAVSIKTPAWTDVLSAESDSQGFVSRPENSGNGVQWNMKRLDPRGQEKLTLRIVPRKGLPLDLAISISQAALSSQATVEVAEPKLAMSISGASEALYGKMEVYKLTLSNPGTADAENVTLKLLPGNPGDAPPAAHSIGTLRAGDKKVIELELTPRQGGDLKIHAMATD